MSVLNERQNDLKDLQTTRLVTTVLRDLSALTMNSTKKDFEKGQSYYKEVQNLYKLIKTYALRQKLTFDAGEKKTTSGTLFVAITSNKRLHGFLDRKVLQALEEKMNTDTVSAFLVIGKVGKQYFQGTQYEKRITFFEFQKDEPTPYENIVFVDTTRRYENVFMFYPKFINVFKQEISLADIAYIPEPQKKEESSVEYIFEPELGEIFWFFETQVRYILFNQILLEVQLSRTASKLLQTDSAEQNILGVIKQKQIQLRETFNSIMSMRLLEMFSGINQWKKSL